MMEPLFNFFMSPAYAESVGVQPSVPQTGSFSFVIMFMLFFIFVYFFIWRPQSKRAKEQQNLLNSLAIGDEVVTAGGFLGKIIKLADQYVVLSIANNVEIVVQKSSVSNVLPKGTLKTIT